MENSIYVVGAPGPLRESLRVLFSSLTDAPTVHEATDEGFACTLNRHHPALVLWIMQPSQHYLPKTIHVVKERWPDVRTIVLVDDEVQHHHVTAAQVDRVVAEGVLASKLLTIATELLEQPERCGVL